MMLLFKPSTAHAKRSKPRPYQSFSESLLLDSIEATESFTKKWISQDHLSACSSCTLSSIFSTENRAEGRKFVDVINSLQYAIQGVTLVNPESHKLTRAHNLLSTAMKHLEKEFYRVLKSNRRNLDPESVSIRSIPSFNPRKKVSIYSNVPKSEEADIMTDLQMIADCMISSGFENECVRTYKKIRRSIIVDSLSKLGFENLSFGKIQKLDWESMEKNIKKWLEATKIVINNLFDGERILCDHVFSTSPSVAESCFSEITLDSALTLFIFPVSVARCRKTAEKIFLTLDVYQTISNLLPRIEEIFSYDSTSAVRFQAADSLRSLGETINYMVAEFEASIAKEASKSVIPGGGVHPLTRYVMNFVVFLADYNESLAGVLTESDLPLPEDYFGGDKSDVGETASTVTTRLGWLILVLLCKIDTKSRIYENVALSYLFLANNLHYVISKVRKSNLRVVLGDEWVANHQAKVCQYLEKYEKVAWGEVLTSLSDDETVVLEDNVAKERLKRFNEAFEEAFRKQSGWVVPDSKMREGLKDSVAKKLTYVASLFYEKYNVETWEDIVRYVPKDLGNYLSDLYLGTGKTCTNVPSFKPTESGRSQLFESGH
ncbi:PREDICTED: exocyst complex component EXO70A1 [Brassica oleracea var. oleracea]|uniref:Exocyst subunit Exo70 family protein n=1 Tax=Brassica oleracea var. oleracea TaxID=109376 RepID=A0A0D3C2N1_BRAOL|nr:PREDICTED: exocyst complex component EXO70A1 [Brassica oleracea var. oleracea]